MSISPAHKTQYTGILIWSIMTVLVLGIIFHQTALAKKLIGIPTMLNPIVAYTEWKNIIEEHEIDFKSIIEQYIHTALSTGEAEHIAVYYRALNNGDRMGINELEYFSPASLMKLPVLIAYLKKSESENGVLDQKLLYQKTEADNLYVQNIYSSKELEEGKKYSIRQLLEYMIQYSSNAAARILWENIEFEYIRNTFYDLGMWYPNMMSGSFDNNIAVKDYASFFRILFNASYLTTKDSERALELLATTAFNDWLRADIPINIKIAHKFGERGIIQADGQEEKQLHDCGIVYYPKHPYILCIMTRWYDWSRLEWTIKGISQTVYNEFERVYNNSKK